MSSLITESDFEYQLEHINDNLQPQIHTAGILCMIAAFCAVGLRFLSRHIARAGLGSDDYTILVALFFATSWVVLIFIEIENGLGRHIVVSKNIIAFAKVRYHLTTWQIRDHD